MCLRRVVVTVVAMLSTALVSCGAAEATTGVGTHTDWSWSSAPASVTASTHVDITEIGSSTYWAFGGGFADGESGDGWYMGLQTDGSNFSGQDVGDEAIFSVWDATGGTTSAAGGQCGQFGGEGTGGSCHVPLPVTAGDSYELSISRAADSDTYTATVTDTTANTTVTVGTIVAPAPSQGEATRDSLLSDPYSFIEDFGPGDDSCDEQPASAIFGDTLLGAETLSPLASSISYGACPGDANIVGDAIGAAVDSATAPTPPTSAPPASTTTTTSTPTPVAPTSTPVAPTPPTVAKPVFPTASVSSLGWSRGVLSVSLRGLSRGDSVHITITRAHRTRTRRYAYRRPRRKVARPGWETLRIRMSKPTQVEVRVWRGHRLVSGRFVLSLGAEPYPSVTRGSPVRAVRRRSEAP
jgi:hypothetical protein